MNNIVCLWYGDKYTVDYVNNLYSMFEKNLTQDFNLTCICDRTTGLRSEIIPVKLPTDDKLHNKGWWQKLHFFNSKLFNFTGPTLAIDLDMVIVDNVDDLFKINAPFVMERDFFPKNGNSTCLMKFNMGEHDDLYNDIDLNKISHNIDSSDPDFGRHKFWGDQVWVHSKRPRVDVWPMLWVKSYKYECLFPQNLQYHPSKAFKIPIGCKIIKFHGEPTMETCMKDISPYWGKLVRRINTTQLTPPQQVMPQEELSLTPLKNTFLGTVEHTGTFFLIDVLKQLSNTEVTLTKNLNSRGYHLFPAIHTHLLNGGLSLKDQTGLIKQRKTIFTVRDPILSFITRLNKHNKLTDYTHIIDGFKYMADFSILPNVFYFPVDLPVTVEEKITLLTKLESFLDIEHNPSIINKMANEWIVHNSTKDFKHLKEIYKKGYLDEIYALMPDAFDKLYRSPKIINFLKKVGYDLIWFDYSKKEIYERVSDKKLIKACICGNDSRFVNSIQHEIPVRECQDCGIIFQHLNMTEEEYFNFYADDYHMNFQHDRGTPDYLKRYKHDKKISEQRNEKYKSFLAHPRKILDIGSSNNAFVDVMNEHGHEAYGVEIGELGKNFDNVYNKDLLDINFPPESFDVITLHDVLEHLIEPSKYLIELHKILKPSSTLVIDFPNFFDDAGLHHWKKIEHLWYITVDRLIELFTEYGFVVSNIDKPIPSKIVFYLNKVEQTETSKLLFMPGMGDIYWTLTKVESFIEQHNMGIPTSTIWDLDQKRIGDQQRSEGYLSKMGFMKYTGTLDVRRNRDFDAFYAHKQNKKLKPIWYKQNVSGYAYFFNMNGFLEIGEDIEFSGTLSDYETNWYPPMFTPLEEYKFEANYKEQYGRYIVGYFTGTGRYNEVFNKRLSGELYRMLYEMSKKADAKVVLIGTTWDAPATNELIKQDKHGIFHSLLGQTNTSQMYALMKGSVGVVGWAAGNTIMATYFKKPTFIFWSEDLWHHNFAFNCIDPDALNQWYFPQFVDVYTAAQRKYIVNTAGKKFV